MEKMLFFAKLLAQTVKEAFEFFYDAGYPLLSFSEDYSHHGGTKLYLKEGNYVLLEELDEGMDVIDLHYEVHEAEAGINSFIDYAKEYDKESPATLHGILFPNEFLYELLYDFGMLGESFHDEKKDKAVKELLATIHKIAGVFDYELHFLDGRIYITFEKKPLDDGSFICENMAEVEVVYRLANAEGHLVAKKESGMSDAEFKLFLSRLELHEWMQTSASDDKEFIEAFKRKRGLDI